MAVNTDNTGSSGEGTTADASLYRSSGRRVRSRSGDPETSARSASHSAAALMGSRKDKETPHTFSLRMTYDLRREMESRAASEGVSVSEWVRRACLKALSE